MNILAIGCHPDDLEISCAGTLIKYVKQGHKVIMCHVTNGNMGHAVIKPEVLGDIRNAEAARAAAVIGAEHISLNVGDNDSDQFGSKTMDKLMDCLLYTSRCV